MGNSFGRIFRLTTFGESHGAGIGGVIEGCPAGLMLDPNIIQQELDRRKPGQSELTTQRKEEDRFRIFSGVLNNQTLGTPIGFFISNQDQKESDYEQLQQVFRPSHADYTWFAKFGIRDHRGGGRSSARETAARVFGGAVAKQMLAEKCGMRFEAWVQSIGEVESGQFAALEFKTENCRKLNCPDPDAADRMAAAILKARNEGDSLGGIIAARIVNVPPGLGEPVFDKVNALLGHALLSINAVKGIEFGSGFSAAGMKGSEHNDEFFDDGGNIRTKTNRSGGIQGGITNGESITFRLAFKPTSTIMKEQATVDISGKETTLAVKGRHDPCVVPRAVVIVEAMSALAMADLWMLNLNSRLNR